MSKKLNRTFVRWSSRPRGRRRPREHILRRADIFLFGAVMIYAIVTAVAIYAGSCKYVKEPVTQSSCGLACTDTITLSTKAGGLAMLDRKAGAQ